MKNKHFELQLTWKNVYKEIFAGFFRFFMVLGVSFWFLLPIFRHFNLSNQLFLFLFVMIALINGIFHLAYLALSFSFMLILAGIYDIKALLKFHGIIYQMDENGLTYDENKELHQKKRIDIIDVGCFKQQDKKIKILYKYQIKFSDGTDYEFNLRGKCPTKDFKDNVEEFWLYYTNRQYSYLALLSIDFYH